MLEIKKFILTLWELFQHIKKQDAKNNGMKYKFWDCVVLTTYDEAQKRGFEMQLQELYKDDSIFSSLNADFHVVADPPNQKLGSGGSTLYVIKTLSDLYGDKIYNMLILIIHSGGLSQRLPSYSVQGKIFSPMPIKYLCTEKRVSLMLDLKLLMYLPFCQNLSSGVFVTCADDIETYNLGENCLDSDGINNADVLSLAHPCSPQTATGHGVYVLPTKGCPKSVTFLSDCLEVLQKPSIELMKEKGAVITGENSGDDFVYSDSVFWMSSRTYRPLLSWFKKSNLNSELDAYAHFLPCLGRKTSLGLEQFTDHRKHMFPIFRDFKFKVLVLNESKFYHIGTMQEYLTNFTQNQCFSRELALNRNTSNLDKLLNTFQTYTSMITECHILKKEYLHLEAGANIITEFCRIESPIIITGNTILSNCVVQPLRTDHSTQFPLTFWGDILYHTIPIRNGENTSYVTVAFEIAANIKREFKTAKDVRIFSVSLDDVAEVARSAPILMLPNDPPLTLWRLRMFRDAPTRQESLRKTHALFYNIRFSRVTNQDFEKGLKDFNRGKLFSMEDVLKLKDLQTFIRDRRHLISQIQGSRDALRK